MGTLSQVQKIIRFLKENQGQFFTARQIALFLVTKYASDYANKRNNPRFADDKAFLSQIIAEIGSQKDALKRANPAGSSKTTPLLHSPSRGPAGAARQRTGNKL